ncbi:hypothetical protein Tco_1410830 [Tanacetum coccineum]
MALRKQSSTTSSDLCTICSELFTGGFRIQLDDDEGISRYEGEPLLLSDFTYSSRNQRAVRTVSGPLGYEVGESSAAGTARQVGPTTARADLYGFADTLEAAPGRRMSRELGYGIRDTWDDLVGAIQEIALTTLEGVNQRVIELSSTIDEEDEIIYSQLGDARRWNVAIRRIPEGILLRDYGHDSAVEIVELSSGSRPEGEDRDFRAAIKSIISGDRDKPELQEPEEALGAVLSTWDYDCTPTKFITKMAPEEGPTRTRIDESVNVVFEQHGTTGMAMIAILGNWCKKDECNVRDGTYQDFMKCQPLFFRVQNEVGQLGPSGLEYGNRATSEQCPVGRTRTMGDGNAVAGRLCSGSCGATIQTTTFVTGDLEKVEVELNEMYDRLKIFPKYFRGFGVFHRPAREFHIDLVPGAAPVARGTLSIRSHQRNDKMGGSYTCSFPTSFIQP